MDTAQFLGHVVAPGNFLAVCYKGSELPIGTAFFPRAHINHVVGFINWCTSRHMDVWYGVASYKMATANGEYPGGGIKYKGSRKRENVERIRCLWYDADIKRPGDNKKDQDCFANHEELKHWIDTVVTPNFYPPDLWVRSGYGVHIYWVFDEPMELAEWQPLADAFKLFLVDNGGKGDIGITADAARILRPPNTSNFKIPDHPAPVFIELSNLC